MECLNCGRGHCICQSSNNQNQGASIEAAPLDSYSPEDRAFYKFWYGHMDGDLMRAPLAEVSHSTARYIWDAARRTPAAAVEADRAQRQAPVVREVPDDGEPIYGQREEEAGRKIKAAGLMEEASILCEAARRSQARLDYRLAASTATVTAPAQPENLAGRMVSVAIDTGNEEADLGKRIFAQLTGELASDGSTLIADEVSRNFAAPAAPAASLQNWLNIIHDNELALGDRLQRISSHIQSILGGDAPDKYPPHTIREQCTCCAAPAAQQADGLPPDVEFKQLADTILQATTNGVRNEALRGMVALFDRRAGAQQAAPMGTLGYALFRNGKQEGVERTRQQAESWINAEIVPLVAAPATAGMVEDAKDAAVTQIPLKNEAGAQLKKDHDGHWALIRGASTIRYLDRFERNFVDSTIDAAMAAQQAQASAKESGAMGDDLKGGA